MGVRLSCTMIVIEVDVLDRLAVGPIKASSNYFSSAIAPDGRGIGISHAWEIGSGHFLLPKVVYLP
jgi:hypothetical protein